MADKITIVVFSGSADRLVGMSVLVSGAVALDLEVDIYLMLWGAYAFKKGNFGTELPLSEYNSLENEFKRIIESGIVPPWYKMLKDAKETGTVRIHACGAAVKAWNAELKDLELVDDIVGASEIVDSSINSKAVYFI